MDTNRKKNVKADHFIRCPRDRFFDLILLIFINILFLLPSSSLAMFLFFPSFFKHYISFSFFKHYFLTLSSCSILFPFYFFFQKYFYFFLLKAPFSIFLLITNFFLHLANIDSHYCFNTYCRELELQINLTQLKILSF